MFPKGGMGGMYKKAQQMQKKMAEIQEELESMEIEIESGGGMVKVKINRKKQIVSIDINQALDKVDSISKEKLGSLTGGMNIPGLF